MGGKRGGGKRRGRKHKPGHRVAFERLLSELRELSSVEVVDATGKFGTESERTHPYLAHALMSDSFLTDSSKVMVVNLTQVGVSREMQAFNAITHSFGDEGQTLLILNLMLLDSPAVREAITDLSTLTFDSCPMVGIYHGKNYTLADPVTALARFKMSDNTQDLVMECSVCLEPTLHMQPLYECGVHVYCRSCIERLLVEGVEKCPQCRARVSATFMSDPTRKAMQRLMNLVLPSY